MAPTFRIPFSEIPKKPILEKGDYQAMIREVRKEPSSDQQSENLVGISISSTPLSRE